ncbi:sensor histidine kinase [Pseudomonas aeruginosa]|uniref:sensor histidine kinase n=1 Tax=Pseudomonas aeruginosa TaxID=287 RepID=UPI00104F0E06|nr:sensor histidine kinase [Pseudomonas aeruginosa]
MAIIFKARVLLELGAELISSDSVALYELIKNGVDAGSKKISIDIFVVLQPSSYRALLAKWGEEGQDWSDAEFKQDLEERIDKTAQYGVSEEFVRLVTSSSGREESLKALSDAFFQFNYIKVTDWGHGMTDDELKSCYLTVGTPTRLTQKKEILDKGGKESVPLGEKGIGRLAAMRIGHYVLVKTASSKKPGIEFELELDWRPIFKDPNLDASALNFEPTLGRIKDSSLAGTQIVIRDLQSDWTEDKLADIAESDLAKLADPFDSNYASQFLKINYQGESKSFITGFKRANLNHADAVCEISFRAGSVEPDASIGAECAARLKVDTSYKLHNKVENVLYSGAHLADKVSHEPSRSRRPKASDRLPRSDEVVAALETLGDFEAKFWWFNRGRLQRDEQLLWKETLQKFVRGWSGGLLVYRDGFRVYPYGGPADDWLDLDRKALASSAYKLNRAQIVGYLRINSSNNSRLQDQTNREGFRDCPEKEAIRRLLRQAIIADCKTFLERVDKENKKADEETLRDIDERIVDASALALSNLRDLSLRVPDESNAIQGILVELAEVQDAWGRAKEALAAKDYEVEQYAHLAGVGLMVELLAHELARSTDSALEILGDKRSPKDPRKLEALESILKTLNKRVRIIDELSIPGRHRKTIQDVRSLVEMMKEFYEQKIERHGIEIEIIGGLKQKLSKRVEKGQILQIIDNLLNNSCYWLARRLYRKDPPKITVVIDPESGVLTLQDNGPGIPVGIGNKVFDALYSTKPGGGRGMGLFIAKKLAKENNVSLELLAPVDGAHRGFLLNFKEAV